MSNLKTVPPTAGNPQLSNRRRAREVALQILFQTEFNQLADVKLCLESFQDQIERDKDVYAYALRVIEGIKANQNQIDETIQKYSKNWKLERMSHVDRNILRIAVFEMIHLNTEVPKNASINEAIEIAKKFGSQDSGLFVNGLLDQISKNF